MSDDDLQDDLPRYAFLLYDIRRCGDKESVYEIIATVEVEPGKLGWDTLKAALLPWGIEHLTRQRWEAGLYFVEFAIVDEEGEPERSFTGEYLAWSGSRVLIATP